MTPSENRHHKINYGSECSYKREAAMAGIKQQSLTSSLEISSNNFIGFMSSSHVF